ncbi:MAG: hypothetical protein OK436_07540, partial [Thaumarchaeota archaeon]|nr:hypothetical protein [Nitrososphaerota archaeon]
SGKSSNPISGSFEVSDSFKFIGKLSLWLGESRPRIKVSARPLTSLDTSENAWVIPTICSVAAWEIVRVAVEIESVPVF